MSRYTLSHLTDQALLRDLADLVAQDRSTTASMLAHLAEVDARKLYLPAGYASMFAYCVGQLRLSEDAAAKRIQAARLARRYPAIFPALADGRLHLAAVCLLAPYVTTDNAQELIEAAMGRTKAQVELLIAERFPMPDLVASIEPIAPSGPRCPEHVCETFEQHAPGHVHVPALVSTESRATVKPLAPQRFGMQVTIDAETESLLRDVQALLGHTIPSGDLAAVLRESLKLAKQALEKRRYAKVSEPRPGRRTKSARHIPAHVRREVWQRDQGRCTFVSESGHRCESRTRLEFDHATPVARGEEATISNLRLRCRPHNQYEAERAYGERFMRGKREQSVARTPSNAA
jgi:5-methylcytosine-specific restriction endonuclease McrA